MTRSDKIVVVAALLLCGVSIWMMVQRIIAGPAVATAPTSKYVVLERGVVYYAITDAKAGRSYLVFTRGTEGIAVVPIEAK